MDGTSGTDGRDLLFSGVPRQKPVPTEESGGDADTSPGATPYVMRISRLTVDKLGIKMYDRVAAVLAEIIANAYDADATRVRVRTPFGVMLREQEGKRPVGPYEITVEDDGHGMTPEEVNSHYLLVGSDRRRRFGGDCSREKQRPVMGRKGIGKLAPFGICETVEIVTAGGERTERGYRVSHVLLRLPDMLYDTEQDYHPEVGEKDGTWSQERGTVIRLREFRRKRVPTRDELDRQLSARFGISRGDWEVEVSGASDADMLPGSEPDSFVLGQLKIKIQEPTKLVFDEDLSRGFEGDRRLRVTGWMAFSEKPYKDEHMAGVRIFARGKIVSTTRDFGVVAGFTGEFAIRSYLVGELHAEWLDEDEDCIRSDRQDIIWTSELGSVLQRWGIEKVRLVAKRGRVSNRQQGWEDFKKTTDLEDRLKKEAPGDPFYQDSVKQAAKALVTDKDREAVLDPDHAEKLLGLARTIAPHRELLGALKEATDEASDALDIVIELFRKARLAEFYSLGQVASERVRVVDRLRQLVENGETLERPLQELIEGAPWLLAPEWTPLGMNESLERVRKNFEAWYFKEKQQLICTSAVATEKKEPDFVLLNGARQTLWIVEIKRIGYHLTNEEFTTAFDYLEALDDFLERHPQLGSLFPMRRLTMIVDHVDRLSNSNRRLLEKDDRIEQRGWHDLLAQTQEAHEDFLNRVDDIRRHSDSGPDAPGAE